MILSGLASTADVDLVRMKFRRYAFSNPCALHDGQPFPPLYWKHDESRIVGEILELKHDRDGNLRIRARVDDPLARRAGASFSVGARVEKYSIINEDSPDFFALIERAEVMEVSLTDVPANPQARVLNRYRPSAASEVYVLIGEKVKLMTSVLKEIRP